MTHDRHPDRENLRKRMLQIQGVSSVERNLKGSIFNALLTFSGWALAFVIVLAPWLYGGTRLRALAFITLLLLLVTGLWFVSALFSRNELCFPKTVAIPVGLLLTLGWWMALNAHFVYDPEYSIFSDAPSLIKALPGSVDRQTSIEMMLRITGLLGVILMVAHLSQSKAWRLRLWWAISIAGVSIITLGLIQKMANAPMIFWETGRAGHYFFATYLYHGNAGAFINLVLPLIIGLTIQAFYKNQKSAMAIMAPVSVVCIAGAFSHASKAGMAISILLLLVLLAWQIIVFVKNRNSFRNKAASVFSFSIVVGAVLLVITAVGWHFAAQRWHLFDVSLQARQFTYDLCNRIIPDAGAFGFGPGTFSIMFDRYALAENPRMQVFYRYAHQDYQQALIEWGWVGALILGILFFGALFIAATRFFASKSRLRSADKILLFSTCLALLGVGLHAAVDFPLQIISLQLLAAVYVGLSWGSLSWQPVKVAGSRIKRRRPGKKNKRTHAESPDVRIDESEIEKFNRRRKEAFQLSMRGS